MAVKALVMRCAWAVCSGVSAWYFPFPWHHAGLMRSLAPRSTGTICKPAPCLSPGPRLHFHTSVPVVLGGGISQFRAPAIPFKGLRPSCPLRCHIDNISQRSHGGRITLLRGFEEPLGSLGIIDVVGVAAMLAAKIKLSQGVFGINITLFGGFFPPGHGGSSPSARPLRGRRQTQTVSAKGSPCAAPCRCRCIVPAVILLSAMAVRVTGTQSRLGGGVTFD